MHELNATSDSPDFPNAVLHISALVSVTLLIAVTPTVMLNCTNKRALVPPPVFDI